ncbi:MAG: hypothetical protein LBR31_03835 [Desulfovibrio sp.]|nr:hypothetical protein [Desulfovibrio sp.]
MKTLLFCWTIFLGLAFPAASLAAEQLDEKQYVPAAPAPETSDTVVVSPPRQDGALHVVPVSPETPAVPVPEIPIFPDIPGVQSPPDIVVLPEVRRDVPDAKARDAVGVPEKTTPSKTGEEKKPAPAPEKTPERTVLTPGHFLPLVPQKNKAEKKPAQAVKEPEKQKPTQPEKKAAEKRTPQKGEALKIPEDAAKSGKLDFLEGCWVGTRPEYGTKRIVRERFCFDKNGVGKRYIYDPKYAGECVGATKALVNSGGILRMSSSKMFCSSGDIWGASEMTCQGEGEQTPCSWVFRDINNARQSYKIQFVRE